MCCHKYLYSGWEHLAPHQTTKNLSRPGGEGVVVNTGHEPIGICRIWWWFFFFFCCAQSLPVTREVYARFDQNFTKPGRACVELSDEIICQWWLCEFVNIYEFTSYKCAALWRVEFDAHQVTDYNEYLQKPQSANISSLCLWKKKEKAFLDCNPFGLKWLRAEKESARNRSPSKNKIKPWYIPFVSHLRFSPGLHIVMTLARLSQAVCRVVWELNWIEKAQDGRGSKDQFVFFFFFFFQFLPSDLPFLRSQSQVSESLRIHFYKG